METKIYKKRVCLPCMAQLQQDNVVRQIEGTIKKGVCCACGRDPAMTVLCVYTKRWREIMEEEKRRIWLGL